VLAVFTDLFQSFPSLSLSMSCHRNTDLLNAVACLDFALPMLCRLCQTSLCRYGASLSLVLPCHCASQHSSLCLFAAYLVTARALQSPSLPLRINSSLYLAHANHCFALRCLSSAQLRLAQPCRCDPAHFHAMPLRCQTIPCLYCTLIANSSHHCAKAILLSALPTQSVASRYPRLTVHKYTKLCRCSADHSPSIATRA